VPKWASLRPYYLGIFRSHRETRHLERTLAIGFINRHFKSVIPRAAGTPKSHVGGLAADWLQPPRSALLSLFAARWGLAILWEQSKMQEAGAPPPVQIKLRCLGYLLHPFFHILGRHVFHVSGNAPQMSERILYEARAVPVELVLNRL
jgi:hypothetical protein